MKNIHFFRGRGQGRGLANLTPSFNYLPAYNFPALHDRFSLHRETRRGSTLLPLWPNTWPPFGENGSTSRKRAKTGGFRPVNIRPLHPRSPRVSRPQSPQGGGPQRGKHRRNPAPSGPPRCCLPAGPGPSPSISAIFASISSSCSACGSPSWAACGRVGRGGGRVVGGLRSWGEGWWAAGLGDEVPRRW